MDAFKLGSFDFVEKPFLIATMLDAFHRAIASDQARREAAREHADLRQVFARLSARHAQDDGPFGRTRPHARGGPHQSNAKNA